MFCLISQRSGSEDLNLHFQCLCLCLSNVDEILPLLIVNHMPVDLEMKLMSLYVIFCG